MELLQQLLPTPKQSPQKTKNVSYELLSRCGYVSSLEEGTNVYLPLMMRVLQKISQIVREEMNAIGAQEFLLPHLQPAEIWKKTGRWDIYTEIKPVMFVIKDHQNRELGLGSTHEETATSIINNLIHSYNQLPQLFYQIQNKFRDGIYSQFESMLGREFMMKDGYSFHANRKSLEQTYWEISQVYSQILHRCGVDFQVVEAEIDKLDGSVSAHKFILANKSGKDEVLYTEDGQYMADANIAVSSPRRAKLSQFTDYEKIAAPNTEKSEKLCHFLKCSPCQIIKNILYEVTYDDNRLFLVLLSIRGDQTVSHVKLKRYLEFDNLTIVSLKEIEVGMQPKWSANILPLGYIGPDLKDNSIKSSKRIYPKFLRLVDRTAANLSNFVTGANKTGYHVIGGNWHQQFILPAQIVDVRQAKAGEYAVHNTCQVLKSMRGVEIGRISKLNSKYSEQLGVTYSNDKGHEKPLLMGCYQLDFSSLVQATVEQHHDSLGIIWPVSLAPYTVIITIPNPQISEQVLIANQLTRELNQAGIDTILDNRNIPAGIKFKGADLTGIPYRIIPGKTLIKGYVELKKRADNSLEKVPVNKVLDTLKSWTKKNSQQL